MTQPISRVQRVDQSKDKIFKGLDDKQKEFWILFLSKYEDKGVEELDEDKLPILLNLKYHAIANAEQILGNVDKIRQIFFLFKRICMQKQIKNMHLHNVNLKPFKPFFPPTHQP